MEKQQLPRKRWPCTADIPSRNRVGHQTSGERVPQSDISEIKTGRKPDSFDAMTRVARALSVGLDDLAR